MMIQVHKASMSSMPPMFLNVLEYILEICNNIITDNKTYYEVMPWILDVLYPFRIIDEDQLEGLITQAQTL